MTRKLCLLISLQSPSLSSPPAPLNPHLSQSTPAAGAAPGGRGTDGELVLVYWQEISILNPYLANGIKDYQAASLVLEPLVKNDPDGNLMPVLAAEVPTVENGGVTPDLTSITWKLRPTWSGRTVRR